MFGKKLVTPQTGAAGKVVNRVYVEEASDIEKVSYILSCLIDESSSMLAFISSVAGGMDIEKVAEETPQKIHTTKVDLKNEISKKDALKILEPFNLNNSQLLQGKKILDAMYQLFLKKKMHH